MKKIWLEKFTRDYKNKNVLIFGLGILGRGAADAEFFCRLGAKVTVTDLKSKKELKPSLIKLKGLPIKYTLGRHCRQDILNADLVLKNAAVPNKSLYIKLAEKNSIPVYMDEALFLKYAPVRVIGVTGTRGKSTTTVLIFNFLKKAGYKVWLAGNVKGMASLPLLEKIEENDWLVMELSSWQLKNFKKIKKSPHISIITNIYQDHLNFYENMAAYFNDKKNIFKYQSENDFLVLNKDFSLFNKIAAEAKSKIIWFSKADFPEKWSLKILGEHNIENAAAAIKIGRILGVNQKIIKKSLESFKGLEQRLELIAQINNVSYINDSASTTPAALIAALNSVNRPIILICGGSSKNLSMDKAAREIVKKTAGVIFLTGTETKNLKKLVIKYGGRNRIRGQFNNLKQAFNQAKKISQAGDAVLLSPGCASFGMFKNEFDRGDQFNKIVLANAKKRLV